jgi:polyphosphate glucokinase
MAASTPARRAPRGSRSAKGNRSAGRDTLSIDVGGSHIKGSVLGPQGRMLHERVRVDTPDHLTPRRLVQIIARIASKLPPFDRVSVGFPGVVRAGVIRTAPNLGTDRFRGFDLAAALRDRLGKPVRVENDADVQGLGAIEGKGLEVVVTLGTGFGTALFEDGHLGPHIELAHHPFEKGKTYEELLGQEALERMGERRWNRRVKEAIATLRALTDFDHLYIGGGNARRLTIDLPDDVSVVSNDAGIWGGIRLWQR